jgi:RNA polymerase sigma-70 factor (ECF subfamily)
MKQSDRITTAFTALREQMLSLAERIIGNRDDAADAVQDAFVKMWQQRGRYKSASHARGAGMIAVRTTSIDKARHSSHRTDVSIDQIADPIEDVSDNDRSLAYRQVRYIIDNDLSNNQRQIIDLREIEGLEFEDIANRMNMTAANVRVELSRARKRVREISKSRNMEKKL